MDMVPPLDEKEGPWASTGGDPREVALVTPGGR